MRAYYRLELQDSVFIHLDLVHLVTADDVGVAWYFCFRYRLLYNLPVLLFLFVSRTNKPWSSKLKISVHERAGTDDVVDLGEYLLLSRPQ